MPFWQSSPFRSGEMHINFASFLMNHCVLCMESKEASRDGELPGASSSDFSSGSYRNDEQMSEAVWEGDGMWTKDSGVWDLEVDHCVRS